jgi:hypothetical protein
MAPAERTRPFARVREEFERLIDRTAGDRNRELERLAGGDAALAREVAALLAADQAASPLLDGTVERFLGLLDEADGEPLPDDDRRRPDRRD